MATVALRNPAGGETLGSVLMLLDSGADVSAVPQSAVTRLNASVDRASGYEVVGFDGVANIAHAVALELTFRGRVFRGRFLTVEQEWASLGVNF